jgi:hypothetical protein
VCRNGSRIRRLDARGGWLFGYRRGFRGSAGRLVWLRGFGSVARRIPSGCRSGLSPGIVQLVEVGCGCQPVCFILHSEIFGFLARNLAIGTINANPADVPERPGTGAIGIKEIERSSVGEGQLEIESIEMIAVDGLERHRKCHVTQTPTCGLGNERRAHL